jgi:hypothetical protein
MSSGASLVGWCKQSRARRQSPSGWYSAVLGIPCGVSRCATGCYILSPTRNTCVWSQPLCAACSNSRATLARFWTKSHVLGCYTGICGCSTCSSSAPQKDRTLWECWMLTAAPGAIPWRIGPFTCWSDVPLHTNRCFSRKATGDD